MSSISFDKIQLYSQDSTSAGSNPIYKYQSTLEIDFSVSPVLVTGSLSSGENGPMQCNLNFTMSPTDSATIYNALNELSFCVFVPGKKQGGGIGNIQVGGSPGIGIVYGGIGPVNISFFTVFQNGAELVTGLRIPFNTVKTNMPYVCGDYQRVEGMIADVLATQPLTGCPAQYGKLFRH